MTDTTLILSRQSAVFSPAKAGNPVFNLPSQWLEDTDVYTIVENALCIYSIVLFLIFKEWWTFIPPVLLTTCRMAVFFWLITIAPASDRYNEGELSSLTPGTLMGMAKCCGLVTALVLAMVYIHCTT